MFVPVGDGIDSDRVRRVLPYAILSVSFGDKNPETAAVPANAGVTSSNLHGVFCDIAEIGHRFTQIKTDKTNAFGFILSTLVTRWYERIVRPESSGRL